MKIVVRQKKKEERREYNLIKIAIKLQKAGSRFGKGLLNRSRGGLVVLCAVPVLGCLWSV